MRVMSLLKIKVPKRKIDKTSELYKELKESIYKRGQLVPITINKKNEILDGVHRYHIMLELRQTEIFVEDVL